MVSSSSPPDDKRSSTDPDDPSATATTASAGGSFGHNASSSSSSSSFSLFSNLRTSGIYLKLMRKAAEATGRPIGGDDDKLIVSDEHVDAAADKVVEYILGGGGSGSSSTGGSNTIDSAKISSSISSDISSVGNAVIGEDKDRNNIRNVGIYKIALDAIKYQRDAYIMGGEYAMKNAECRHSLREEKEKMRKRIEKQEAEKEANRANSAVAWGEEGDGVGSLLPSIVDEENAKSSSLVESIAPLFQDSKTKKIQIPPKPTPLVPPPSLILDRQTSLGKTQLVDLGEWFIPSPIVYDSLKPTVLWLSSSNGPLHQPSLQSTINIINMSQDNLNWVMKNNIMWYLQDDAFRSRVKGITGGYIHDESNAGAKNTKKE